MKTIPHMIISSFFGKVRLMDYLLLIIKIDWVNISAKYILWDKEPQA